MPGIKSHVGWSEELLNRLELPKITLYEMLSRNVEQNADKPIIWFLNTFMTYRQFIDDVDRLAASLHRLGLRKGDVVALIMPSCFQYPIAYYACAKLGIIVTGINPIYKPTEALHQLKVTGARTIITLDALYDLLITPILSQLSIERLIVTNLVDLVDMPDEKKEAGKKAGLIPTGSTPNDSIRFLDLLNVVPEKISTTVSADDVLTYVMTGGTTGVPKAAVLTHYNCVSLAYSCSLGIMEHKSGCLIGILPMFHVFGMGVMNTCICSGSFQIIFPRPPDTESLLRTICDVSPDGLTVYPANDMLLKLLADFKEVDKYPLQKKLRGFLSGAGPLQLRTRQQIEEKFPQITLSEGYGLSEASSGGAMMPLNQKYPHGTIGIPFPGIEWRIVDIEKGDKELPPGETGELILTGPTVMKGYLNLPDETAETIRVRPDGKRWLHTGDIGYMDDEGRVYLNDRKKLLIKVSGFSVFPSEIEKMLTTNEWVAESVVAGLPDEKTGEAIKAWIVLRADWRGKITVEQIRAWCKETMTYYKVPKHIEFIEQIPKTIVGKVLRRDLQESDPIYIAWQKSH
jgi:long-chain acyl-CoA synthetase